MSIITTETTKATTKAATIVNAGQGHKLNVLGHVINVILSSAQTQGDSFVFEAISPTGLSVPTHVHQHEDEVGYVIEGVYEVFLGDKTFEAKSGAVIYCPRNVPHGFRNIGSTTARIIWISTPGVNVDPFFNDLGALPTDTPPDLQKITDIFAKYDMQVLPPHGM